MRSIVKEAYAKINLTLEVGEKRPDGYHNITSVMARASLFDTLEISENNSSKVRIFSNDDSLENEENLCAKAVFAYFSEKNMTPVGIDIRLEKRIPVKSGLGGGSADCAATIEALEEMYGALSSHSRHRVARALGADVPYCFLKTPALCKGIGDDCRAISSLKMENLYLAIQKRGEKLSTGTVYSQLDEMEKGDSTHSHEKVIKALEMGEGKALATSLFNDFERVVLERSPVLIALREEMYREGALGVVMSGAGPSLVGFFDKRENAEKFGEVYYLI